MNFKHHVKRFKKNVTEGLVMQPLWTIWSLLWLPLGLLLLAMLGVFVAIANLSIKDGLEAVEDIL